MHSALTSPDLLHRIFVHLDQATRAICARVCKQWFEPSVKHLWYTVDDLWICFRVLAPLVVDTTDGAHVSSHLSISLRT